MQDLVMLNSDKKGNKKFIESITAVIIIFLIMSSSYPRAESKVMQQAIGTYLMRK